MATYNKTDIIPIDQLNIDLENPFEVYSWAPELMGEPEEAKEIAIWNMSMKAYAPRKHSQGVNNITTAGIVNAVLPAITKYFPDPLSFENRAKALELYRDLVIHIVNYYVHKTNQKRNGAGKKKLAMLDQLNFDMLVEIIFGYHEVVNFVASEADKLAGILMTLSKDEENNPDAVLVNMKNTIADYMVMLSTEKYTKENLKKLDFRIKSDFRTKLYITDPSYENGPKYAKDAIPLANGVYIRELYQQMGRLITYREAYKEYGLFFPSHYAARYLGDNNPVPIMEDGTRPDVVLKELYMSTPEREMQMWGAILSVLRANDDGYNKGLFFMDDGMGSTGKSTLLKWWRHMVGPENCAKLSLSQIAQTANGNFSLAILRDLRIKMIYSDENEPKDFYNKMSNLKELITGDPITVSTKYENDVTLIFHGRIAECINNGIISSSDNTESMYRRILAMKYKYKMDPGDGSSDVPDNVNIKKYYVTRQDWIDWLATEAINKNITKLIETDETKTIKAAMEERNNKVLRFMNSWVRNMTPGWFRIDYLWPAFQVFITGEKFDTRMTYPTFEDEVKKIIARKDNPWTYVPESDLKPDTPKAKNCNAFCPPLTFGYDPVKHRDATVSELKHDKIYQALMEVTAPGSRYASYSAIAKTALNKMYRGTKKANNKMPGTMTGAYYRTPEAEIEHLKYLAAGVLTRHDERVNELELMEALAERVKTKEPKQTDDDPFEVAIEWEKIPTNNYEMDLLDYVEARFKKLGFAPEVM